MYRPPIIVEARARSSEREEERELRSVEAVEHILPRTDQDRPLKSGQLVDVDRAIEKLIAAKLKKARQGRGQRFSDNRARDQKQSESLAVSCNG